MSWARIDDTFWRHDKVRPLVEAGEWQALALWLLGISYTNMKGDPSLSDHEAAMLMQTDTKTGSRIVKVLRSRGLFEDDSASKQTVFHDWSDTEAKTKQRSKRGAKAVESLGKPAARNRSKPRSRVIVLLRSKREAPIPIPIPSPSRAPI